MLTISDQEFDLLATYIKRNFGIHLSYEKKALVVGRLQQVLFHLGMQTFSEYYQYLIQDKTGQAYSVLINQISTNHTYFMRESEHFDYLKQVVLPEIAGRIKNFDLRVWCAACSTGEEAYILAMILEDMFPKLLTSWDKKLLATDISANALERAVKGQYSTEALSKLPAIWRTKYLTKVNPSEATFTDRLKQEIIFRRYNLISNVIPFKKKVHVIFCRNVLIYFDTPTKEKLIQQFYDITEPGGYLFIGHSESIEKNQFGYQYIRPSVYRKPL